MKSKKVGNTKILSPQELLRLVPFVGLHHLVQETAAGCEMDVRCSVLQNVILSGGTTCFEQLPERLTAELQKLSPSKVLSE